MLLREGWIGRGGSGVAIAAPALPPFLARPRPGFSLVVDLGRDLFTPTWWRGLATCWGLVAATVSLHPPIGPLGAGQPERLEGRELGQWQAIGVSPIATGSASGMRMTPGDRVMPIDSAPARAQIDLYATLGPDGLGRTLARQGASDGDSLAVQSLVAASGARPMAGTGLALTLGPRDAAGRRPILALTMRAALDLKLAIARGDGGLTLTKVAIPVDHTPLRIRGRAGDGLYWALRTAGASSAVAADYLRTLSRSVDVGAVGRDDRFTLVLASRRSADGERQTGPLLYAGLDRVGQRPIQLVRWDSGGQAQWIDAADLGNAGATPGGGALQWPVDAPITSTFGPRLHPILRFVRMHKGLDFGAHWGQPIRAAADGQVSQAGWAGGYGRQVRIAHGGGLVTSYSHMSSMVVAPGTLVHAGQVIGYVGSSGLSTGPHLHYEVLRGGVAVNPMGVRFAAAAAPVDQGMVAAVRARVKGLLGG